VETETMTIPHQQPPFTKEAVRDALDRIMECGLGIVMPCAVSNDHLMGLAKLRGEADKGLDYAKKRELDTAIESIQYVNSQKSTMNVNLQDFMGADLDYLQRFCRETAKAGVNIIELDDISGPCHPAAYNYCTRKAREAAPDARFGIHVHNDFALGLAGVMASIEAGAEVVTCGMNGYGERAGHCDTAQIAIVCEFLYGLDTGLRLEKLTETARLTADLLRQTIPKDRPVVGENAYSHLHDWHWEFPDQPWAVCALRPEVVGNKENVLIGEWSGPYGLMTKAKQLGLNLPFKKTYDVLAKARDWMRWHKRPFTDDEFRTLLESTLGGK
jgi:isopropylmalate/homocitrate/citramalate synthase